MDTKIVLLISIFMTFSLLALAEVTTSIAGSIKYSEVQKFGVKERGLKRSRRDVIRFPIFCPACFKVNMGRCRPIYDCVPDESDPNPWRDLIKRSASTTAFLIMLCLVSYVFLNLLYTKLLQIQIKFDLNQRICGWYKVLVLLAVKRVYNVGNLFHK